MPCWTVSRTTAKLEAADRTLLAQAITRQFGVAADVTRLTKNHTEQIDGLAFTFEGARVLIGADLVSVTGVGRQTADDLIDALKQSYAREVVTLASRTMGWDIEESEQTADGLTFTLAREE